MIGEKLLPVDDASKIRRPGKLHLMINLRISLSNALKTKSTLRVGWLKVYQGVKAVRDAASCLTFKLMDWVERSDP